MTPLVLGLVAIAAVAHATWNIAVKRAGTSGAEFIWLTFVVGAVLFLPFGLWSILHSGLNMLHWLLLASVSAVIHTAYFFLLQTGYRKGDISVVYPLSRGTGPLFSVILAILLLGERPEPVALAGAALIVVGVMITGMTRRNSHGDTRSGVLFGLAIGVMIAAYTVWDSAAVTVGAMPAVGMFWGSMVFQSIFLSPLGARHPRRLLTTGRRHWVAVLMVGVLSPLGYILILLAVQMSQVSLVAPAREVSVVLVSLAGWLVFREPRPAQRLAGATVVLAGIALLALG